jgi:hypothetical protein
MWQVVYIFFGNVSSTYINHKVQFNKKENNYFLCKIYELLFSKITKEVYVIIPFSFILEYESFPMMT